MLCESFCLKSSSFSVKYNEVVAWSVIFIFLCFYFKSEIRLGHTAR